MHKTNQCPLLQKKKKKKKKKQGVAATFSTKAHTSVCLFVSAWMLRKRVKLPLCVLLLRDVRV